MIYKIEVGKKYIYAYDVIEVLAVGKEKVFYAYEEKENDNEFVKYIKIALKDFEELDRETITLTEHICNYGAVNFLTNDLKLICYYSNEKNKLIEIQYKEKCIKAPNARSYKVYADTLEPVK